MPDGAIYGEHVDLTKSGIAETIEKKLVNIVETIVPVADRSEAEIQELKLDRTQWIARVKAKVVVKNSEAAGIPNPDGGPNLGHFSLTSEVKFTFDIKSGNTSDEELKIKTKLGPNTEGPDIDLDIGTMRDILEGDFAKAVELIPNGGLVEREIKSDYKRIRNSYYQKHGRENVYFASARFVRWAGLGTAGKWVAQAIASGGSASGAIMAEAKKEALKELDLVKDWLISRGQQTAQDVAQKLLSGQQVSWPFIKLVFQTVRYSSKLHINGRQVGGEFAVNRHIGFVIIWVGQGGSNEPADTVDSSGDLEDDASDTPPIDDNFSGVNPNPVVGPGTGDVNPPPVTG